MRYLSLLFCLGLFLLVSCEDQMEVDTALIQQYLVDNNLDADVTEEGVYYVIERTGVGVKPDLASKVVVHYEGKLLDGTIFDSSYARVERAEFPVNGVIQGWQIGLQLMKEGGKAKLIIPSELGYGRAGSGASIPGNSVLVFDVELFEVK